MWSKNTPCHTIRRNFEARCTSLNLLRQWRLPLRNPELQDVPAEDILLFLLSPYRDEQFHHEIPSFSQRLAACSIQPRQVFTDGYPLMAHVVYFSDMPETLLRGSLRGIITEHKQMRMTEKAIFPTLTLLVHLVLARPEICKVCQEEGIIDLLEALWWQNALSSWKGPQPIRVWVVVLLGALVCQMSLPDAHSALIERMALLLDIYLHSNIIEDALKQHPTTCHFLVVLVRLLRSKQ